MARVYIYWYREVIELEIGTKEIFILSDGGFSPSPAIITATPKCSGICLP